MQNELAKLQLFLLSLTHLKYYLFFFILEKYCNNIWSKTVLLNFKRKAIKTCLICPIHLGYFYNSPPRLTLSTSSEYCTRMSGVSAGSKVRAAGCSALGAVTLASKTWSVSPTMPQSRATLIPVKMLSPVCACMLGVRVLVIGFY